MHCLLLLRRLMVCQNVFEAGRKSGFKALANLCYAQVFASTNAQSLSSKLSHGSHKLNELSVTSLSTWWLLFHQVCNTRFRNCCHKQGQPHYGHSSEPLHQQLCQPWTNHVQQNTTQVQMWQAIYSQATPGFTFIVIIDICVNNSQHPESDPKEQGNHLLFHFAEEKKNTNVWVLSERPCHK